MCGYVASQIASETQKLSAHCRSQLKKRDEEFAGLQNVHDAVKEQLEQQTADLSNRLSKVSLLNTACITGMHWQNESKITLQSGALVVSDMLSWMNAFDHAALLLSCANSCCQTSCHKGAVPDGH